MSEIQISDIKYFVQENYIDEIDGKKLESALKLQESVKERISIIKHNRESTLKNKGLAS